MIRCIVFRQPLCIIHQVFSVTQYLTEEKIQMMREKEWYQDALLSILLPKLFRHENLNENQGTLRDELLKAIAERLKVSLSPKFTSETAKLAAEQIVHESLSALVVESFYWGEYQREYCEWHDTIIVNKECIKTYEGYGITTTEDYFEKEAEKIRNASNFEDCYYQGINESLRKSLPNNAIEAFKERVNQGGDDPRTPKTPWYLALPRRTLIVFAVCFLILACSMVLYKYGLPLVFNANHVPQDTELSSDITGENSGIPSESQSFCMLSQDGIVTFSSDSISIIRYKMCSSQDECSRVDWEKPDGFILPTESLYVKNTGWLALKAYSENENLEIENFLEVDFCMILTNLIRSYNHDMLGKLVDDGTLYSVDNEDPEGSRFEDYLRSSYAREAFSEKGGYQVTDYDYAEGLSTELSALDCPRYPKLKVVYINKRK